jgi:transcriptional regulator with GAF, ATPase, and Fis domain
MDKLLHYNFPGNVRELRNLIERACILTREQDIDPSDVVLASEEEGDQRKILEDHLQRWLSTLPPHVKLRHTLEEIERELVLRALRAAHGVQAEAARTLELSRSDVAYKIKKYALENIELS